MSEFIEPEVASGPTSRCKKIKPSTILLGLSVPVLAAVYFLTHPFATTLATRSIDTYRFGAEHRVNFDSAVSKLDMVVIQPGATFSFNNQLGPRESDAGYLPAPSYLGRDRINSSGGGICLVSSMLYQAALLAGLSVTERTPHQHRIASVPPGLDATVWYGIHDLKIKNPYDFPVEIATSKKDDRLTIEIKGKALYKPVERHFVRRELARDKRTLQVEVYLASKEGTGKMLSRDTYLIR